MRWRALDGGPPRPIALPSPAANAALAYVLPKGCYWLPLAVSCTLHDTDAALAQVPVVTVAGDDGVDYLQAPGGGELAFGTTRDYSWWIGAQAVSGDAVFSAALPEVWLYGSQTLGIKVVNHDGTAATAFQLSNVRLVLAQIDPAELDGDDA